MDISSVYANLVTYHFHWILSWYGIPIIITVVPVTNGIILMIWYLLESSLDSFSSCSASLILFWIWFSFHASASRIAGCLCRVQSFLNFSWSSVFGSLKKSRISIHENTILFLWNSNDSSTDISNIASINSLHSFCLSGLIVQSFNFLCKFFSNWFMVVAING